MQACHHWILYQVLGALFNYVLTALYTEKISSNGSSLYRTPSRHKRRDLGVSVSLTNTGISCPSTEPKSQLNQGRRLHSTLFVNHQTPFAVEPKCREYQVVDRSCKSSCFEISLSRFINKRKQVCNVQPVAALKNRDGNFVLRHRSPKILPPAL
jgi:hypothetical protein